MTRIGLPVLVCVLTAAGGLAQDSVAPFLKVDEAVSKDDFAAAQKELDQIRAASRRIGDTALEREALDRLKDVRRLASAYAKLKKVVDALKRNPDDLESNRTLAIYQVAEKGDWAKGLPLLIKGGSVEVREVAAMDLEQPKEPTDQRRLAERWLKLAEGEKPTERHAFELRGRYWYLQARPKLSIVDQTSVDERLRRIPVFADRIVVWNQNNGGIGDRGSVDCLVSTVQEGKVTWKQTVRLPWHPTQGVSAILRPPRARVDQVRVDVLAFRGRGGGLAEVQVFDGQTNVSEYCPAFASEYWEDEPKFHPSSVTDGVTESKDGSGIWLLNNSSKGWIAVDLAFTSR